MNFKLLKLDFEALLSQMVSTNGFLHYGLWDAPLAPQQYSLENIAAAQLNYFERMLAIFPAEAKKILDVGSGTGSNALALTKRGFEVDCVCPSPQLNLLARAKLPAASAIHESRYEDFNCSSQTYDLAFFAESFHYIDPNIALAKVREQTRLGAVIFDYFPKRPTQGRQTYLDFESMLKETGALSLTHSIDLTNRIAITFDALQAMRSLHLGPFLSRVARSLRDEHPLLGYVPGVLLERRAQRWIEKTSRRADFERDFEYRLIRLEPCA